MRASYQKTRRTRMWLNCTDYWLISSVETVPVVNQGNRLIGQLVAIETPKGIVLEAVRVEWFERILKENRVKRVDVEFVEGNHALRQEKTHE